MAGRGLTIERMVKLAQVSRASYYRFDENGKWGSDSDMDLRDVMQGVALEWTNYGRRRITRELHRRGWANGHPNIAGPPGLPCNLLARIGLRLGRIIGDGQVAESCGFRECNRAARGSGPILWEQGGRGRRCAVSNR